MLIFFYHLFLTIFDLFWANCWSPKAKKTRVKFGLKCPLQEFYMKNDALLFKWSQKMVLIGSTDLIVCFGHFGSMFWTNLGPIYAKMAKYDCEKASFYNLQAKTCIKRIKLSEIVDFCLFYIYLTILHLFWTNFGSVLDYLWTKFGL